ncbi:hypothetical protein JTB14_020001 [Gonioctena quinquepunctata]|nr:hypothetical protein JTB14_020001 [Gonioctena quinquepunctata]
MIKYYGRHGCKQFIRGKPIRFGYKMWSLNSNDGYLIDFDLYQGDAPREDVDISKLVGKCAAPMVLMLKELPQPNSPHIIHIDNLFTGLNLLAYLRHLGYGAIGTIRENRIPRSCPIRGKIQFKKKRVVGNTNMSSKEIMVSSWYGGWTTLQMLVFSQKERYRYIVKKKRNM